MSWVVRGLGAVVFAGCILVTPRAAHACGAAYPGGPVMCDYPRKEGGGAATRGGPPILRLSTTYAFTSTTLRFGDGKRADLTRHSVFGSLEVPLASRLSAHLGGGGIASGALEHGAARDAIGPGLTGFVGVAGRVFDGQGALPFLQLTATLSTSHAITRGNGRRTDGSVDPGSGDNRYTAFDLRIGAIAGKTIEGVFTPYVAARAFGGPVYWRYDGERVTGTDVYKYQLGGGVSLALFQRRLDVFAEGVALGERGVAAGIGTTFF